jgi:uncharacterized protein (TIGR03437 family)
MRLSIAALLSTCTLAAANVQVWQDTVNLLTWSEGPPDTNPRFELLAEGNYPSYPYAFRTNFLADNANVAWRQLNLENEYLFCRVLPDLGGHLYSCRDKINGQEMFYPNPVIRKGWVGLRGAWVPLGIELNFPVTHSLITVSPVSFGTQQYADGSAGVWVADIDRQTGMEWRVEWVLRPASAVLEEQVWLYNRGDSRQPYHFWSNSEETIQDQNSGFQYPMLVSGTHGFTVLDTWPVNQAGVDMSVIRNYTGQVGLFAYGSNESFFAAYHPATRTGTAHFADPATVPGKKLWAWGPGPDGDIYVETSLTQNFPSYIETQGGATPNQETRLWLDPQQASHFTEYWMPVRQLDGVSRANQAGVLYMGRATINSQAALVAEFNANTPMAGVTIKILNGAATVFTETVSLDPGTTYVRSVANPATGVNYTFQIMDPVEGVVFTHTGNTLNALGPNDVTLGAQTAPDLSKSDTDQEVLARGLNYEQFMQYGSAESTYSAGLALFPQSAALLKAAGRLAVSASRFTDAVSQLTQVPGDGEAQYYLGLAYAGLGQQTQAAAAWTGILSSPGFGAAAAFQLACQDALTGDLVSAATLFDGLNTVRAGALEVAVLRHQGNTAAAGAKLAQWQAVSPTDLFLRNEAVLLGGTDAALRGDLSGEPERVLNLVDDYFRLGFWADAVSLLAAAYPDVPALQRELGTVTPQNNALIAYYRGYAKQRQGGSAAADFNAASGMALPYLFPNRFSSFAVLGAALQTNPSDASAHFLLGLLWMSRRQVDNAIAEWQAARSIQRDIATLHRNLGRAYLDLKNDPNTALPILLEGLTYDPNNSDLRDAYQRALQLAGPPRSQTVTFAALANRPFGAAPFGVSATASSGLAVSFGSTTSAVCTVSGATVTLVSVGTCTIQATQAGNPSWAAAPPVNQSFQVTQAGQAITFGALSNQAFGTAPFTVSANASSGLAVSFNSQTTAVCTVSGATVTLVSVGTCTIQAKQAGNPSWAAAPPVNQSFQVTPAGQTITFGALSNQAFGTAPFGVSATASSGLAVSFNSQTTAVCTVSGATVTLVSAGTCTIQATQAGNSNYAAATPVSQSFQVTPASQTISFGALSNKALGTAPFAVSASATSGLAVSFNSQTTPVCTVSGATVTLVSAGTCTIRATQAGNVNYAAATSVNQSFQVTQGGSGTNQPPSIVSLSPFSGSGNQTFTLGFSDPNGWADIAHAYLIINLQTWVANSCYVDFNVADHIIALMNDAGTGWLGMVAGSTASVSNSQCTVSGAGASASGSGNNLTVTLALTFQPSYTGAKRTFLMATDSGGLTADWLAYGVWYPNPLTATLVKRYRLYFPVTLEHLYTTDLNEYNVLGAEGWNQEGADAAVYNGPAALSGVSTVPMWRLYYATYMTHLWTTDRNEYLTLMNYRGMFVGEGADQFLFPSQVSNSIPLYRLLFNGGGPPIHHWTTDAYEFSVLTAPGGGWTSEGIPGYLFPPSMAVAQGEAPVVAVAQAGIHVEQAGQRRVNGSGAPEIGAIVHGASYEVGPVAAGQVIRLYGSFPEEGELGVVMGGVEAEVVARTEREIQAVIPETAAGARVSVTVMAGGRRSNAMEVEMVDAAPGLLASDPYGRGQAQAANEDGSANSAANPAAAGSIVSLSLTGHRGRKISVQMGGRPAEVVSQRELGSGKGEVRVRIPEGLAAGAAVPVRVKVGEFFGQAGVTVAVR